MKYIEELIAYQEDIDATQIAEILWLSQFMGGESSKIEEPKPTPNRKSQEIKEPIKDLPPIEESETVNHTSTPQKQKTNYGFDKEQEGSTYSTHIHKKEKFPNIEKQFNSLRVKQKKISKKSIDEIKTADYIATTGYFHPIFSEVKSKGSYFTLHIIIDRSESIFLWESYTQHFIKSMKFSKTFKKIRIFELNSSKKEPSITILNSHSININSATFREDKSLTLIFSDITGNSWKSNRMFEVLDSWSKGSFVAIVSMLPKRMWRKTPLRQGISLFMKPTRFLPKNRNLKAEFDFIGIKPNQKVTNIPLLTFDSYSFSYLSNVLIGKKGSWIDSRIFKNLALKEVAKPKKSNILPSQRVKNFFSFALPKTRELAIYCSVLPLNNEIIREVIKTRDLGNEKDVFAEFYFGGLLDRDAKASLGEYAFYDGVAKELRQYISVQEFEILLGQVSGVMSRSFGVDYQKINLLFESDSDVELNDDERALVELMIEVLGDKGRFYEGEVENLKKRVESTKPINNLHFEGTKIGIGASANITLPSSHIIPKVLTFPIGLVSNMNFVGRKEELQKIDELLNQKSGLLLLNGIGGVGKSTLASYYLNQKKDNFDYYGFVQVNEDIKLSLASALGTSLDLKSEKINDLFAEIMNKLHSLEGKKLLIIDDVKEMDSQIDEMNILMTLKDSGFQILFTSRETKEFIPQYFLDIMNKEDARELFLRYYPTDEIDKVDKILEYLDYHTLFIEMTAKTLIRRKKTLSLDKMMEKFSSGEFSTIKKSKRESFTDYLNNLFSFDKLDNEEILILKQFSTLPSIEIEFEFLEKIFNKKNEELEDLLIYLCDKGWIVKTKLGYKLHQIMKEYILSNHIPNFEDIEAIFESYSKLIENSADILVALKNRENLIYFDSILNFLDKENKEIAVFLNNLGDIYYHLGVYNKSENLYIKSLKMKLEILGEENLSTANSYNSLANLYQLKAEYDKAEPYYLKALTISKKILGEEHLSTVNYYNNLANLYQARGEYKKAEPLYLKSLKIREKILGKEHPDTAISYNNLAGIYETIGAYQKAELLYLKSLKINEKILGKEHPDTAISYNNLANLYQSKKEYQKAKSLYLKSLNIREKLFGKEHFDTAISYNNLAFLYYQQKNIKEAHIYMKKAVEIYSKILPKNHPNLINAKKGLELFNSKIKTKDISSNLISSRSNTFVQDVEIKANSNIDLQAIIEQGKNAKIDFKKEWYKKKNLKKEFIRDILALVNGDIHSIDQMAYLIIGIDDNKEVFNFDDSAIPSSLKKLTQQLLKILNRYSQPKFLSLDIEWINYNEQKVLVLSVAPLGQLISLSKDLKLKKNTDKKGTVYYRIGENIHVASADVIKDFEKAFDKDNSDGGVTINISGDVKGIGVVTGGTVSQTINNNPEI